MARADLPVPIEFREFDLAQVDEMAALHDWSTMHQDMLPLTTESIARHHLSSAAYINGELAGYGAISVIYSREVVEFGGMVVNPNFRRKNIGSSLVRHVVQRAHDELEPEQILAFGNEKSSRLFRRLGGTPVKDVMALPSEVWKLCYICPRADRAKAAGKNCCERVFDLTSIETGTTQ